MSNLQIALSVGAGVTLVVFLGCWLFYALGWTGGRSLAATMRRSAVVAGGGALLAAGLLAFDALQLETSDPAGLWVSLAPLAAFGVGALGLAVRDHEAMLNRVGRSAPVLAAAWVAVMSGGVTTGAAVGGVLISTSS